MTVSPLLLAFFSAVVLVEAGPAQDPSQETKIVNGREITIADAPWQVALLVDGDQNCGGSIISPEWVLTAAHCTFGKNESQLTVRIGSANKHAGGTVYQVETVVNHEDYDDNLVLNDISLMKTTKTMQLDSPVKVVTLAAAGTKPDVNTKLTVSGWGLMENNKFAELLRAADIYVHDYADCEEYGAFSPTTQICAGGPNRDSCSADSGGPLVDGDLQVGLVSWGAAEPCGLRPSIYTDVAAFRDWIKEKCGV